MSPTIFGIVNITEDSFSDGGRYLTTEAALTHARKLARDGAAVLDLGAAYLVPVDANSNGIADAWEAQYFPGGMSSKDADDDHDNFSNYKEWLAGTSPNDSQSALIVRNVQVGSGFTFSWPTVAGRTYRVSATNVLFAASSWPVIAGPWEAVVGQTNMQWTDTGTATNRFYRIELVLP